MEGDTLPAPYNPLDGVDAFLILSRPPISLGHGSDDPAYHLLSIFFFAYLKKLPC